MQTDKIGILAIDQGTTSSRAIVFLKDGTQVASAQQEFTQYYPENGWVEHDPAEIWRTTLQACQQVLQSAKEAGVKVTCIGITNQRETTVVWDKRSATPIYNAIVWQDRRTAALCSELKSELETVRNKTGLLLDPYFSATKISWILDEVSGTRTLAEQGHLAFGTIDTFLAWHLSGGHAHVTDATNASRTNLYNIQTGEWDDDLLSLFRVPKAMLPEVKNSADDFGITDPAELGAAIPITGIAGDQQAALFGQCCFKAGELKSTYGTGCFALLNTGNTPVFSENKLLTTIAYQINNQTTYALEGAIFTAGANVQWLRDGIGVLESAKQSQALAQSLSYDHGVFLVPGFAGLGAPHWDPNARGALFGMTRDTTQAHLARAALEAVCYQTYDLLKAMQNDGMASSNIWVDGGMVANDWLCQFLADILDIRIQRPKIMESTALGAAYLAGLHTGIYENMGDIASHKQVDKQFTPRIDKTVRATLLKQWQKAVTATLAFAN
jgi:glycerol kinase